MIKLVKIDMIQSQLKLKLNKQQQAIFTEWLWHLTGVWNWAIRKIELNAKDHIYYSKMDFQNLLVSHSKKLGIPSHVLQGTLSQAHLAWSRCFKKIDGHPHLKGQRNKLNSIPVPDKIHRPEKNHINIPAFGPVKFHKQEIPKGRIKCGRIVKRASGWYLCLFIEAERELIVRTANGKVGIDPGFKSLLTLSTGEKIEHPRELEKIEKRIARAQRGHNKNLVAKLSEHRANQVKDRNHKLSLRLVKENVFVAFSADSHNKIAKKHGKSVSSSAHGQLQRMLSYKSRSGGTEYVEPISINSTRMCSDCRALTGPVGRTQLSVRYWVCSACGAQHDRDTNAAINALNTGLGMSLEVQHAAA
jgi:putative transposase